MKEGLSTMAPPLLQVRGLKKAFGAIQALSGVDLDIYRGEVHVLLGENGAGKSTLLKVLSGVHVPDEGKVTLDGRPLPAGNPGDSGRAGIVTIHQEFNLILDLSVAENVFLGREPRRFGLLDHARMHREAKVLLERVGLGLDPARPVRGLGVAQAQLVEIARALGILDATGGGVLTLDEPTAALAEHEITLLHDLIRQWRTQGLALIYISHRMPELRAIGDRVTVLRDGASVATGPMRGFEDDELIRAMVGREVHHLYPSRPPASEDPLLEVEELQAPNFGPVSLAVARGEILGVAGLMGAGRTRLLRLLYGASRASGGRVRVADKVLSGTRTPAEAVEAGIGLVPEDRKHQGLALGLSISDNLVMAILERFTHAGFVDGKAIVRASTGLVERLRIRSRHVSQPAGSLSGGNQQKVVLGRWLARDGQVILLDEPTRGVDVGARAEIYQQIADLAAQGKAMVMVSSDLPELLGMADRILVMREGRVAGILAGDQLTQENVMRMATGHGGRG